MLILTAVLFFTTIVSAEKDSNYYPWGTNPNVKHTMFWNDASNVLQDLTQFQALYIKYHSCVWTPYASGSDSYACTGGGGGDDQYWYMGSTPCFRANAAFSLYGVLMDDTEGNNDKQWKRKGTGMCNAATYINSFFTTYGIVALSNAMGIEDELATTVCTSMQVGNGYQGGGNNNNNEKKYMSSTTGCLSGKFVYDVFQGKYCDGNKFAYRIDLMEEFNQDIEEITCNKIWDYDYYVGGSNNNNNNHRDLGYGSIAESVLYYSKSCSVYEYPGVCPDPFGTKKRDDKAFTSAAGISFHSKAQRRLEASSTVMMIVGLCFMILAYINHHRRKWLAVIKAEEKQKIEEENRSFMEQLHSASSSLSSKAGSIRSAMSRASVRNYPTSALKASKKEKKRYQDPVLAGRMDSQSTGDVSTEPSQPDGIMRSKIPSILPQPRSSTFTIGGDRSTGHVSSSNWAKDPNRYNIPDTIVNSGSYIASKPSNLSTGSSRMSLKSADVRAAIQSVEMATVQRKGASLTIVGSK